MEDQPIQCEKCGWEWKIADGGDDLYTCHKCGHDNNPDLNEGKQVGLLYHYTSTNGLKGILRSNRINASEENYLGNELYYISFTRNKNFHKKGSKFGVSTEYRITLDGDKLSNKYKIRPFAYIPGWDIKDSWELDWLDDEPESVRRDFFNATGDYDEQEERIFFKNKNGGIDNIKNYILAVDKIEDLDEGRKKKPDPKKGGERSKGQTPIKVKTESTNMDNSNNFLQHFQSQTKITGDFKYIGQKNDEKVYTMPLTNLGDMKLIINDAMIMARISETYAYFGIIYTLTGLEQFDATVLLLKMQNGKIESKQFDENDSDFSNSKTKFASLIKLMVEKQNLIKVSNEEITPEQSEKIGMPFKDTGKSAPYGSGYKKIKALEERLNLFLEKNVPTDASKWSYYKSQAKKKFDVYPSAYANGWAAKMYKKAGGGWKKG